MSKPREKKVVISFQERKRLDATLERRLEMLPNRMCRYISPNDDDEAIGREHNISGKTVASHRVREYGTLYKEQKQRPVRDIRDILGTRSSTETKLDQALKQLEIPYPVKEDTIKTQLDRIESMLSSLVKGLKGLLQED